MKILSKLLLASLLSLTVSSPAFAIFIPSSNPDPTPTPHQGPCMVHGQDSEECKECVDECNEFYDGAIENNPRCVCSDDEINCTGDINEYWEESRKICLENCGSF